MKYSSDKAHKKTVGNGPVKNVKEVESTGHK